MVRNDSFALALNDNAHQDHNYVKTIIITIQSIHKFMLKSRYNNST